MTNKFWILLFNGNTWLSYSKHDTFEEAKAAAKEVSPRWPRTRITLVLEDNQ